LPRACLVVCSAKGTEREQALANAGACIVADKLLDYDRVIKAIAECRSRRGPGVHGGCHMNNPRVLTRGT
jgi:hypothetical protein